MDSTPRGMARRKRRELRRAWQWQNWHRPGSKETSRSCLFPWGIHEAAQPFQVAWFSASDQTMCSKFSISCEMRAFSLGNCLHHKDLLGFVNSPWLVSMPRGLRL
jgi:hypothetical protein